MQICSFITLLIKKQTNTDSSIRWTYDSNPDGSTCGSHMNLWPWAALPGTLKLHPHHLRRILRRQITCPGSGTIDYKIRLCHHYQGRLATIVLDVGFKYRMPLTGLS